MIRKIFSGLLYLLLLGALALLFFSYRNPDVAYYIQSFFGVAPCQKPITYSLGPLDAKFNISQKEALAAITDAEKVWENAAGRELFTYSQTGHLKINFIYDYRQAATDKLKSLGFNIDSSTDSYQRLKAEYQKRKTEYEADNDKLQQLLSEIQAARTKFDSEVIFWNKKGGAPKLQYDALTSERNDLQTMINEANALQDQLVSEVSEINAMVDTLNSMARDINVGVDNYNKIGQSAGKEFEEGIYESSALGQSIDIYQFRDRPQLVRVLAHELGHALGLDHVSDPKAIMYELNQSANLTPSKADKAELNSVCHIK